MHPVRRAVLRTPHSSWMCARTDSIFSSGRRAWNKAVPLRSEHRALHVRQYSKFTRFSYHSACRPSDFQHLASRNGGSPCSGSKSSKGDPWLILRKKNSRQNTTCHHFFKRYEKQPALSTITEHEAFLVFKRITRSSSSVDFSSWTPRPAIYLQVETFRLEISLLLKEQVRSFFTNFSGEDYLDIVILDFEKFSHCFQLKLLLL